ncbi:MAG: PD40 domain-containing protein [Armatimonadetes bacterium]|nr:PD40 domain-containing protein [Armatimonadota bacterium]MDE2206896.1 PD40 domain-containing protein [Armatimonadota bacterium]
MTAIRNRNVAADRPGYSPAHRLTVRASGRVIDLSTEPVLGQGGEARVYALPADRRRVVKIFHTPSEERAHKLLAMLANPPSDPSASSGHISIAWPQELVLDGAGAVVGYVMPRAPASRPLFEIYNPWIRRRATPLFNTFYLHRAARNLAGAVRAVHAAGYVIGDLNESNVLVADTALITLVDTDSFQVPGAGPARIHRCRVAKPEFTAPELQHHDLGRVVRRDDQDLFGLAVLIFMLLMEGVHPFAGVYRGAGEAPDVAQRIAGGLYPYSATRRDLAPMPWAPEFETLHPVLRHLFVRCFEEGLQRPRVRPSAATWIHALEAAEADLTTCAVNSNHRFASHVGRCPWCKRLLETGGLDPFPAQGNNIVAAARRPRIRHETVISAASPTPRVRRPAPAPPPQSRPAPLIHPPHLPAHRVENHWSLIGATLAIVGAITPFHLAAGVLAAGTGAFGYGYSRRLSGAGRRTANASIAAGAALCAIAPATTALARYRHTSILALAGSGAAVHSVAWSPDGKRIAAASGVSDADRTGGDVQIWNAETGDEQGSLSYGYAGDVNAVTWSPDGRTLAVGSGGQLEPGAVKLWDTSAQVVRQELRFGRSAVRAVCLSPNGMLAAAGCDDGEILVWTVTSRRTETALQIKSSADALAFSPDSRLLAIGEDAGDRSGRAGAIGVFSLTAHRWLWRDHANSTGVYTVAWAANGSVLATAGADTSISLWNPRNGRSLGTLDGGALATWSLAFDPRSDILAAGGQDGMLRFYHIRTHSPLAPVRVCANVVQCIAYSPSGRQIACGGGDGLVRILSPSE